MRIDVQEELWCSRSTRLKGKHILFCVAGSVAIFKVPEIIRETIREGALVSVMISPDAAKMVSPAVFEWASGTPPITDITGNVEHVLLAGAHSKKVDLIVVSPVTANTIGKVVNGIADSNISLTIMTGIGTNIPVLLVPGMHEPMFNNPFVHENIIKLRERRNVFWIEPRIVEGKAKLPENRTVSQWIIRLLSSPDLKNKSVLVTGGPTREFIDRVRFITNPSSGKMGLSFALECWYRGADVTFIVGPNSLIIPEFLNPIPVTSVYDMAEHVETVIRNQKPDLAIFSSAVADYSPIEVKDEKIRSGSDNMQIQLKKTPKILQIVKKLRFSLHLEKMKVIAFKAEYNKTNDELVDISSKYITDDLAHFMIANLIDKEGLGFETDSSSVLLISENKKSISIVGSKSNIAFSVLSELFK